jgi:MFS family permease
MSAAAGVVRRLRLVLGTVAGNRDLRRVQIAFAAFNGAETAVWIAMLVYAYDLGGATAAGLVALAQLVPAAIFAPFASVLGDRRSPVRVLTAGYVVQSGGMAATAVVLFADGPPALAIACSAIATTAVTVTRPTQAVLLPALARRPEELTAANVVSGWNESVSMLVAPAIGGVLLAVSGPGAVFAAMAVAVFAGAAIVSGVRDPAPGVREAAAGPFAEVSRGLRVVAHEPAARLLVGLLGAEFAALGMLDVLFVILALDVLDIGESGAGFLNAAFGLGGALAIAVTVSLVGRARLMPAVLVSLVVWTAAFAVLSAWPTVVLAFVALAIAGGARALFDVSGRTLLQRTAPPEVLARVFGVLEALEMVALALGALIAPLLVAISGGRVAVLGAGLLLPALALMAGRRLFALDASAHVPIVEIALLRSLRIFAALPPPQIEGLARCVEPVSASPAHAVITQGEDGDRYYAVADGDLEVLEDGVRTRTLTRGDGFGEIALIRDVPRTATVRALTQAQLYALEKDRFLEVVTGHPATAGAAASIAREWGDHAPPAESQQDL